MAQQHVFVLLMVTEQLRLDLVAMTATNWLAPELETVFCPYPNMICVTYVGVNLAPFCQCSFDYSGPYCNISASSECVCGFPNMVCNTEGECVCKGGWYGDTCSQPYLTAACQTITIVTNTPTNVMGACTMFDTPTILKALRDGLSVPVEIFNFMSADLQKYRTGAPRSPPDPCAQSSLNFALCSNPDVDGGKVHDALQSLVGQTFGNVQIQSICDGSSCPPDSASDAAHSISKPFWMLWA